MFADEFTNIGLNPQTAKYYRGIGYSVEKGQRSLRVKTTDIMRTSHMKVNVVCDYCGDVFCTEVRKYYVMIENEWCPKTCCKKCLPLKRKESNLNHFGYETPMESEWFHDVVKEIVLDKYGVDHISKVPQVREKTRETCLKKYGKEYYLETDDAKNRRKNTNLKKYGCEYVSQSDVIKDKIKSTNMKRYGVEYVSQSDMVKDKVRETCLLKYGAESYPASAKGRAEARDRLLARGIAPSSAMQRRICDIVGGVLNYPWNGFFLDILYDNWLDIEYNGGGHNLNVKMGQMSQDDFVRKERGRTARIIKSGYKQLVIANESDVEVSDDVLFGLISSAIFFLENFDDKYLQIDICSNEISTTFM